MYYESFYITLDPKNRMVLPAKIAREGEKNGGDFLYFRYLPEKECVVVFLEDNEDFEFQRVRMMNGKGSPRFVIPNDFRDLKPFTKGNKLKIHYFPKEGFFRIYSRESEGS